MKSAAHTNYERCSGCGHELRVNDRGQTLMVNEALKKERMLKPDLKDKFQVGIVKAIAQDCALIVDIGSGSGRFLYHVKQLFHRAIGVEVTPECIEFARTQLGLEITSDPQTDVLASANVITFWHSLEHIPIGEIGRLLGQIQVSKSSNLRVVVSVPNVQSLHYGLFGRESVYYDLANHIHQFSTDSLERLFKNYGFEVDRAFTGFGYSFLGAVLSFVNWFTPGHNFLYLYLRRSEKAHPVARALVAGLVAPLVILAAVPAALIYVFELMRPQRGGVLTLSFRPISAHG
jgi:SAM-dependent methyltransferase